MIIEFSPFQCPQNSNPISKEIGTTLKWNEEGKFAFKFRQFDIKIPAMVEKERILVS